MFGTRAGQVGRSGLAVLATFATVITLLTGCSRSDSAAPPLLLGGPNTNITVAIPRGWHQVIDSSNTQVAEMVTPVTCMGAHEVDCALGLARVATMLGSSARDAEQTVEQAILTSPGVTPGAWISTGPTRVGARSGYTHRFTFNNASGTLTCELAAVASGLSAADAQGNHEYSVILVWISGISQAPSLHVIDHIVESAEVIGGAT
jgi:hypothetical protein